MLFLQTYSKEIVSILIPFLTWLINTKLKDKTQIYVATLHKFTFLIQQPLYDTDGNITNQSQTAHTQSLFIKNSGKVTATNIEVVLNWKTIINIWPTRYYDEKIDKDGRHIMIFDSLSPNESIGIELLSINNNLPDLITVRSNECVGQNIAMAYYQVVPPWKVRVFSILVLFGFSTVIYLSIQLIKFLVLS